MERWRYHVVLAVTFFWFWFFDKFMYNYQSIFIFCLFIMLRYEAGHSSGWHVHQPVSLLLVVLMAVISTLFSFCQIWKQNFVEFSKKKNVYYFCKCKFWCWKNVLVSGGCDCVYKNTVFCTYWRPPKVRTLLRGDVAVSGLYKSMAFLSIRGQCRLSTCNKFFHNNYSNLHLQNQIYVLK